MTPKEMVDELIDLGSLTKWEENFLASLDEKLSNGHTLSERELEKLEEIYDKV